VHHTNGNGTIRLLHGRFPFFGHAPPPSWHNAIVRWRGTSTDAGGWRQDFDLLLAAWLISAGASWLRRRAREPVPPELLTIGTERLTNEQEFAERFNGRGSALIAAAGVILGLTVNLGQEVFDRLSHKAGQPPALDLGSVGRPIFIALFLGAMLSLALSAVVASTAVLPSTARRLTVDALRNYQRRRMPMADLRDRVYTWTVNAVDDQRINNGKKVRRLRLAVFAFVTGIVLVALDAATLAVQQIGV